MNFWWIKAAIPHVAGAMLSEFPKIEAWVARIAALGHGKPTPMEPKDALAIAKAATSDTQPAADESDPRGLKSGDKVTVSADDYGRDPIAGEIVFSNRHEIAIKRNDPAVGEVVVHFPRAGFTVVKA
jgi:glutathione S-transferase